uniref:Uncharacterized protein n=1 Tax=Leersia perrieri TaxID=77586 RepID=A0A0D9UZV2_9ORYZ
MARISSPSHRLNHSTYWGLGRSRTSPMRATIYFARFYGQKQNMGKRERQSSVRKWKRQRRPPHLHPHCSTLISLEEAYRRRYTTVAGEEDRRRRRRQPEPRAASPEHCSTMRRRWRPERDAAAERRQRLERERERAHKCGQRSPIRSLGARFVAVSSTPPMLSVVNKAAGIEDVAALTSLVTPLEPEGRGGGGWPRQVRAKYGGEGRWNQR